MTEDWIAVGHVEDIPFLGARVVKTSGVDIAIFKTAVGEIFALEDKCPHSGGALSQGIVHDRSVTCPLHGWNISLESGQAQGADSGCSAIIPVRVVDGRIFLTRPAPMAETAADG